MRVRGLSTALVLAAMLAVSLSAASTASAASEYTMHRVFSGRPPSPPVPETSGSVDATGAGPVSGEAAASAVWPEGSAALGGDAPASGTPPRPAGYRAAAGAVALLAIAGGLHAWFSRRGPGRPPVGGGAGPSHPIQSLTESATSDH